MKFIFICLLSILLALPAFAQPTGEFRTIMDQIFNELQSGANVSSLDSTTISLISSIQANGSWPDVDYQNASTPAGWAPRLHFTRMVTLARAFSNSASAHYGSETVRQAVISTMNYWLSLNPAPTSSNWFHYAISLPRDIGQALICMRYGPSEGISSTLESQMITWMTKGVNITTPPGNTGSNLTDIAQHYIMRACLTQNASLLKLAVTETAKTIAVTAKEGIQADQSYTAHGAQLYIYGYGSVFISGITNIGAYVKGTSYAFNPEQIAIISNFVRRGFIKVSRGSYTDFNVFGRGISRPNAGLAGINQIKKTKDIDIPTNSAEYDVALARMNGQQPPSFQVNPEHLHYWRTDYTLHHRANYLFGLRSVSTRTVKSENGNGENLKGYYLTEGVNYIAVNGDEYLNIYPVWDWNKLPGTTVPEITTYPVRTGWGANPGKSVFVGGVSDGTYGASTYRMNDYGTTARKGWFFFDDEIVCLGAGITSSASQSINTTLNQCLLSGPVTVSSGSASSILSSGNHNLPLKWAWHNEVGYYFPEITNARLSNQAQSGSWKSINSGGSADPVTRNVFKLWINHGTAPSNGNYSYIILPGKPTAQEMASYSASHLRVLSNTDTVQLVSNSTLDQWQAIFYAAGSFTADGITLEVDRPCALIIKNVTQPEVTIAAADPSQLQSTIGLRFKSAALPVMKELTLALPSGQMAGSSVSGVINSASPDYIEPDPSMPMSIEPIADSHVRDGAAYLNVNYGQDASLVIKNAAGSARREVYLKFDLSNVPAEIDSAVIKMRVNYAGATATSTQWEFYEVASNSWTENGITWSNRPAPGARIGSVPGTISGTTVTLKITNAIRARLTKDKFLTLRVASAVPGEKTDASFASRENVNAAYRPQLTVYPKQENSYQEIGRISPVADAFVRNGTYASSNYGTQTILTIKNDGSTNSVREVFMKFDLASWPSIPKQTLLQLYVPYAGSTIESTNWELHDVTNQSWTETGITWANRPASTLKIGEIPGTVSGRYVLLDISDWILSKVNSNNAGVPNYVTIKISAILAGSTTDANFSSRENDNPDLRPQMIALGTQDVLSSSLLSFSAERLSQGVVQLNWTTSTEKEDNIFRLEKSLDGHRFETIQVITGRGSGKKKIKYNFLDSTGNGTVYYRLCQIGHNNSSKLERVVTVTNTKPKLSVSPNPTSGLIQLNLNYEPDTPISVYIYSISGQQVLRKIAQKQIFDIDLSTLSKGVYIIKTIDNNSSQTHQIVVN
ncbi:polysaccharide lyase family 8 super-sandwich domain-containing protein [Pontibacter sp. 13R65]|uniref:polysaccharide lyase family 8 super-sandwich domain-containing protein n=1 Tax=Pontibacter sp. 13R65 TaxID=3127458 RepID=UPI00301D6112